MLDVFFKTIMFLMFLFRNNLVTRPFQLCDLTFCLISFFFKSPQTNQANVHVSSHASHLVWGVLLIKIVLETINAALTIVDQSASILFSVRAMIFPRAVADFFLSVTITPLHLQFIRQNLFCI